VGLDTKTYWLTDRQSQCDFDFDFKKSRNQSDINESFVIEILKPDVVQKEFNVWAVEPIIISHANTQYVKILIW
jgi:hypothetical protein